MKRKPFRIERQSEGAPKARAPDTPGEDGDGAGAAERHREVMAALASLNRKLDRVEETTSLPAEAPAQSSGVDLESYRQQIVEAEKLRSELQELSDAIQRTKEDILSMRYDPRGKDKIATAGEALRAVVADTEGATDGIIQAAETIEEVAGRIAAEADDQSMRALTDTLGEQVTQIFEHCNFQDITGQRITKVVRTMEFIDERVARMIELWGDDGFTVPGTGAAPAVPEGEVLDGPASSPDQKISQDDIDKLFD